MARRNRISAVIGFLAGAALGALALEGGLRLILATPLWQLFPVVEPILGQPDYDTGFAFTPNVLGVWIQENRARVRINALGLRDSEMTLEKPPGVYRVGLIGDSMTEALQVGQQFTFDALAETRLADGGKTVQIANLAMSGNGPLRQLVRLEKVGLPLNLDMVVSITSIEDFATGEMLDDSGVPGYVPGPDGTLIRGYGFRERWSIRLMQTKLGHLILRFIQDNEVPRLLYGQTKKPWRQALGLARLSPGLEAMMQQKELPTNNQAACRDPGIAPLSRLWIHHQPQNHWHATRTVLREFSAHLKDLPGPIIFILDDIPRIPKNCGNLTRDRAAVVDAIRQAFREHGLGVVDLRQTEVGDYTEDEIASFFPGRPGHLNYFGHEIYAKLLADIIADSLPDRPRP